ncbi:hypothetical protein NL676_026735 [Syzygium grande]|nr:hypothetical protein NL676_026735 [Syzygium grande]
MIWSYNSSSVSNNWRLPISHPLPLLHVQDLQTKKKIGGGHEHDGLYYLDGVSTVDANGLAASPITPYYGIPV